jgi:hypothetical protein
MLETCTDEVYAISEDNGSDKEVDKSKKNGLSLKISHQWQLWW